MPQTLTSTNRYAAGIRLFIQPPGVLHYELRLSHGFNFGTSQSGTPIVSRVSDA